VGSYLGNADLKRAKTSIPVPQVHSYSTDPTNEVGAPYILMDYVHGTVARELRQAKKCEPGLYGTPDQDRRFRQQMAAIQAELSSFTFNQIGSLYRDEQTGDFFIGPEVETGKGPWTSPMDYYADRANHELQVCARNAAPDVQESWSFAVPVLFKHLMSLYGDSTARRFRLVNRDFGAHNLLVNNEFEIVSVIDLDGVMAAPMEVVAQYPALTGLDREAPGHVETRPAAIERIKRTAPKLKEYRDMVEIAEARVHVNEQNTPIADLMLSDAASVFQGLLRYGGHQRLVNDKWMEAYLRLLRGHVMSEEQRESQ